MSAEAVLGWLLLQQLPLQEQSSFLRHRNDDLGAVLITALRRKITPVLSPGLLLNVFPEHSCTLDL